MKALELTRDTIKGNIFAIEGDDSYWVSYAEHFFVSLVSEENRCFDVRYVDNMASYNAILEAIDTPSLMGDEIVVIVKDSNYKEKSTEKGALQKILSQVPQDTYLVFSKVQFLTPKLKKELVVIDASKLEAYDAKGVIKGFLGDQKIDNDALNALIEYTNRDMARMQTEVNKLQAYALKNKITLQDIEALVANTIDNEVYEFCNAIAVKNLVLAYKILDRFVAKGISYSYILASLIGQYRRMLHASLASDLSNNEVATKMGSKPFAIQKAREASKKYSKVALKQIIDNLVDAEFSFKSGKMSEATAVQSALTKIIMI